MELSLLPYAQLHAHATETRFFGIDHAVVLLIDLERIGIHFNVDVIFFRCFRWYSPRVPASETSSILEAAALDNFAFGVLDRKLRFRRPAAV